MGRVSKLFHAIFAVTLAIQLVLITYIIVAFNNPDVPVHFSFTGTADSIGSASEYYLLIGINLFVYMFLSILGKFAKVKLEYYGSFKNEAERKHVEQSMKTKIKIFVQTFGVNFSLFITLLVIFILVTVLNNVSDNNLSSIGIIAFFVPNIVIVIFGLIWINKN